MMNKLTLFLIAIALLALTGCDQNQEYANKYSQFIASKITEKKTVNEFYQPSNEDILQILKNNEDKIPIENFNLLQSSEGIISLSVKGKTGQAQYQTPEEYKLEVAKKTKIISKGPIIKKFSLGMSPDSVLTIIRNTYPETSKNAYKKFDLLIAKKEIKEDLQFAVALDESFFLFDENYKLIKFQIGKSEIDYLFNSESMSIDKFSQLFVNSYKFIEKLSPWSDIKNHYVGLGSITIVEKGYYYDSDYGWELKLLDCPQIIGLSEVMGIPMPKVTHQNTCTTILLTKKKSVKEVKFGD